MMTGFSLGRFLAVLHKEWIQVRRDPMTLRLIIALPVMQLFLFGYAINTDPKHLPTGLLSPDHSQYVRTIVAALRNTGYYDIRPLASEEAAERALTEGEVLFVINIPPNFERSVDRGETPAILVDADATDPSAIGNATVSVRRSRSVQSGAADRPQYRAGSRLHRSDVLDIADHNPVDHPRAGARHDGELARHAGQADRGHGRQNRPLYRHRLCSGRADHGDFICDLRPADPRFTVVADPGTGAVHRQQSCPGLHLFDDRNQPDAGDAVGAVHCAAVDPIVRVHVSVLRHAGMGAMGG